MENQPRWYLELFYRAGGGYGSEFLSDPEFAANHCWVTTKEYSRFDESGRLMPRGNLHRHHIVPLCLGGSNHPSNFAILHQDLHKKVPHGETVHSTPATRCLSQNIFIDWIFQKRKEYNDAEDALLYTMFPELESDQSFEVGEKLETICEWMEINIDGNPYFDRYDLAGIDSEEWEDTDNFLKMRHLVDSLNLFHCDKEEIKQQLYARFRQILTASSNDEEWSELKMRGHSTAIEQLKKAGELPVISQAQKVAHLQAIVDGGSTSLSLLAQLEKEKSVSN